MRPKYETPEDKSRQREVAEWYAKSGWGVYGRRNDITVKHTPELETHDAELYQEGKLIELVEIKCRTVPRETYQTYMLSQRKHSALLHLSSQKHVPASLLVKFTDGLYRCYLPAKTYVSGRGGRADRDDPLDNEEVVYIPLVLFAELIERRKT